MSAPQLFELGDDRSRPRRAIGNAAELEKAEMAVRACPTRAIALRDG